MAKQQWKPGNMLYPLPAVMVTVTDGSGTDNVFTAAWTGTVCSSPPMVSLSVRPERFSYHMIEQTGEFVINLTTEKLAYATDYCGIKSGRNIDKFEMLQLRTEKASLVRAPLLADAPVCLECRVTKTEPLGSHTMFVAEVVAVHADEDYLDENNRFDLSNAKPIVYSHGAYYGLGRRLGTFGYSVKKKKQGRR